MRRHTHFFVGIALRKNTAFYADSGNLRGLWHNIGRYLPSIRFMYSTSSGQYGVWSLL